VQAADGQAYGAGVTEVSCRAFSYFADAERAGLCDTSALLAGLPVTLAEISDPSQRVSWEVWTIICDRFADAVGGNDDAVMETARFAISEGFSSYLGRVAGLFVNPERLYEVSIRWGAAGLFRAVSFGFERQGDAFLISADLLPGFRPCRPWFLMLAGGMRVVPRYIGQPDAVITVLELDDRHTKVLVQPSPWQRVGLAKQALAALRTPGAVADELAAQQQQLAQAFLDMRRAEASFGNVLAALPMAVLVHAHNKVRWTNPAWVALGGDAVGKGLSSLFDPPSLESLRALGPGESATLRVSTGKGGPRMLRTSLVGGLEFQGEKVDLLCAVDVTAEHTARERLFRSQATVHALLDTQPELVLRFDRDLILLDVIPGRAVVMGPTLVAAVGKRVDDLISLLPPGSQGVASVIAEIKKVIATGAPFEESVMLADGDGHARRLHVRVTPIDATGPDGAPRTSEHGPGADEVIVVVRDETNRMDAERRLALVERLASLGTLASGVAHEINNPLTFLSLGIEELRSELRHVPADRRDAVDEILHGLEEGARRIRDTVEHLREMSRPVPQPEEHLDVKVAIERAIQATIQERRQVPVAVEVGTTRPARMAAAALSHVLVHLLTRAARAVNDSGEGKARRIGVSARDEGDVIVLDISDTGAAIAGDLLPRVFGPFATVGGGPAGMGLTIVHSIVRGAGGTIDVQSGEQGTTFSVRVPAGVSRKPSGPALPAPAPAGPRGRVVVIDDEPLVASFIARVLSRHEVQVFNDARAGLQALMMTPPDVVICDVMMPGISGLELHARVAEEMPDLIPRMLFVSGGVFTEKTEAFLRRPDVRALAKPFTPTAIRGEVERIMDLARAPRG